NSFAAEIHIGCGLDAMHFFSFAEEACIKSIFFGYKIGSLMFFYQGINHIKSDIMSGLFILLANISQSHNQKCHNATKYTCKRKKKGGRKKGIRIKKPRKNRGFIKYFGIEIIFSFLQQPQ